MTTQRDVGAPSPLLPGRFVSQAYVDNWSRKEFQQGALSGFRDALAVTLLSRVVGGAIKRRGR